MDYFFIPSQSPFYVVQSESIIHCFYEITDIVRFDRLGQPGRKKTGGQWQAALSCGCRFPRLTSIGYRRWLVSPRGTI